MTPEKCPGCGAKLRPDMLACPNCPMSFPEDDGPSGSVNPLKQSPYYQFVFPVLFFGAIGAGIWYLGMGLMHLGLANNQIENGNVFGGGPSAPAHAPAAVSASGASAPTGAAAMTAPVGDGRPAEADSADSGVVVIARVAESGAHGKRPPPPKPVKEWKLRGAVYDLTTLKPLAGCALAFTDEETNRAVMTRTDSSGRYRVIVPPLGGGKGYSVAIERRGYAANYLNPGTEGVREMPADERRGIAHDLSSTLTATPATVQSPGAEPLVTDFFLAPRP